MRRSATISKTASNQATIASIWTVKILATLIAATGAVACLAPALEMNLAAHAARGGPWYEAAPYLAGVFVAAAAGAILPIAKRHKAGEVICACIVLGAVAVSFNLKNALTASTLARVEFSDPRKAQMERIGALENRRKMLAEMLAKSSQQSSQQSSQELRAMLAAKEADPVFTRPDRSARCTNSTVATSAQFCAERAAILAQIARAEEREKAEAELADIRRELASIGTRPSVADPVVNNLSQAVQLFMPVSEADQAIVGWANDLHTALFVELAAAMGPMLFVFLIGLLWKPSDKASELVNKPETAKATAPKAKLADIASGEPVSGPLKPIPASAPACVRAFLEGHIVRAAGSKIAAGDLYAAYVASVGAGKAVTQNMFGRHAGKVLMKDGARYPAYLDVAVRGPRLAVVSG